MSPLTVTLTVANGPLVGQAYEFREPAVYVVGRAAECYPRLPDELPYKDISRRGRGRLRRGRRSSSWCTAWRVQCISRPISASVKPRARNSAACRRRRRFGFFPLGIALPLATSPARRGGGRGEIV